MHDDAGRFALALCLRFMFHPHAEAARVRMFARMGVRLLVVLLSLAFLRDVSAAVVSNLPYQWFSPGDLLATAWHSAWRASPWIIGAAALLVFQGLLVAWMVPTPLAGCVRCGYVVGRVSGGKASAGGGGEVCPECGLKGEADDEECSAFRTAPREQKDA